MPVDTADVETLLGRDLTTTEADRAFRLVDLAQGLIEGELPGFTINPGTETVEVTPGSDEMWTPRYPVTAINSITVDDIAVTGTEFNQLGRIRYTTSLLDDFEVNLSPFTSSTVTIDYDYGFDDLIPDDVSLVVAGMVSSVLRRQTANPDGLASTTLGAYSESHFQAEVAALAQGMVVPTGALRRWRRNRTLSVPLYR